MRKMSQSAGTKAVNQAKNRRDKAMLEAAKRKEDYLGARVPKALKEKVLSEASELGIPVSLLIRKVLEEVFLADSDIHQGSILNRDRSCNKNTDEDPFQQVIGWKEIELNKSRDCDSCNDMIPNFSRAIMGVTASTDAVIICCRCKEQISKH